MLSASAVRERGWSALAVLIVLAGSLSASPPVLVTGLALAALGGASVVRPAIRERWWFNVAVGACLALYGAAYAVAQSGAAGRAVAVGVAAVGLLAVLNHLGVAPWSDHLRRV